MESAFVPINPLVAHAWVAGKPGNMFISRDNVPINIESVIVHATFRNLSLHFSRFSVGREPRRGTLMIGGVFHR